MICIMNSRHSNRKTTQLGFTQPHFFGGGQKSGAGFTIIELIVSLALFTFVLTVSVGALLVLIAGNQKEQSAQSVMTNLAFALDSMTREIRTGYDYYCDILNAGGVASAFDNQDVSLPSGQRDCPNGAPGGSVKNTAISFVEGGSSITGSPGGRIAYVIDLDTEETIYRRVGNGPLERIVSSGVRIIAGEFRVTDPTPQSLPPDHDTEQASVTIYLLAVDADEVPTETNPAEIPDGQLFHIQTTITQRELDL